MKRNYLIKCLFALIIFNSCNENVKNNSIDLESKKVSTENSVREFKDSLNLFLEFYKGMNKWEVEKIHQNNIEKGIITKEQYFDNSTNTQNKRSVFVIANKDSEFKADLSYPNSFYFENQELKFITLGIDSNQPKKVLSVNELKKEIINNKTKLNQLLNIFSKKYGNYQKVNTSMTSALLEVAIDKIDKDNRKSIRELTKEFQPLYRFRKDNKIVQIYYASPELSNFGINIGYSLASELDKLEQEKLNKKNKNIKLTDENI
ncbi:hypothetical protein [Mesoflavibacter sp. SCSIO 43206]|uniref:hypothetical protein n=1 Tax=Mesoflavibacter sp. SCSIO 43206 TaxID=2779362 RepID=UPI001CA9E340|nr:hypothetical protein [Mesoflavibacter sp. SCSIO 43206]UAB75663.1 hypothetical protein INR78_01340 [Mesoflavibacter sp. SCSIO 43206]